MNLRFFGHPVHLGLLLLWIAETLIALCAFLAVWHLHADGQRCAIVCWTQTGVFGATVMMALIAFGLFSRRLRDRMPGIVLRVTVSSFAGSLLAVMILAAVPGYRFDLSLVLQAAIAVWLLLVAVRAAARGFIEEDIFKRRAMIYGGGTNASRVQQLRRRADQRGFRVVGYVLPRGEQRQVPLNVLLDSTKPLRDLVDDHDVDEIVVAMEDRRQQLPLRDLLECRLSGIEVTELVTFLERETGKVYLDILNPSWMIFGGGFRRDILRLKSERAFDLLVSALLLLLSSPLIIVTILAIKLEEGWRAPVFYRQPRVGYAGKIFDVLKFRSMRTDAEKDGKARWASPNDDRATRVGSLIRKIRVDELPQLLNVLIGNMSFVGPRPERPEFVDQLSERIPYYAQRHSVKPGITGWAQLCYPYGASEQDAVEKLQYDLYYVKNHGLIFDILILLQTVEVVLFGKGAR